MACDPESVISSTDLINLKSDITTIDDVVESSLDTTTTKSGKVINTLLGQLRLLGYEVPVSYAVGIVFTASDNTKTVEEAGVIYAPLPSALPFTTSGTFIGDDDARFFVVQGDYNLRTELAAAGGAALTGYELDGTGSVATTVETRLQRVVYLTDKLPLTYDGTTYVNTAWANAMEHFSDGKGGKLIVPPGDYLVEPTYRQAGDLEKQLAYPYDNVEVELQGNLIIDTHGGRYLGLLFGRRRGSTSTTPNRVKNISLTGSGKIIGDRDTHTVSDTNYGLGVFIANCEDSYIAGSITVEKIYGDGYFVDALPYGPADGEENNKSTAKNVVIFGTTAENNYRNNVTVQNNLGVTFFGTKAINANGGAPQAGFDIEPDYYDLAEEFVCSDVKLVNCIAEYNAGAGIDCVDTSPGKVDSVLIQGCTSRYNGSSTVLGYGIRVVSNDGTGSTRIADNEVTDNYGDNIQVSGNGSGAANSQINVLVHDNYCARALVASGTGTTFGSGLSIINGVQNVKVHDNICELNAYHGIYVNGNGNGDITAAGVASIYLDNNVCVANSQETNATYDNIHVNTGSQNVYVSGGMVRATHPRITVTNQPRYGVNLVANENHIRNVDAITGGITANINVPNEALDDGSTTRKCLVNNVIGYKNSARILSGVQNVDATGNFSITIAHNLDTLALATVSLRDNVLALCSVQMIDEGTIVGNPVVVSRATSIDETNIVIKFTVVTAGSSGDQMRAIVHVNPPTNLAA